MAVPRQAGGARRAAAPSGETRSSSSDDDPVSTLSASAVVALCCVSFANTLPNEFSFDDNFAIVKNSDVTGDSSLWDVLQHDFWGQTITSPLSHKSWRPVTTLTFRWNFWFSGLQPESYHAVNLTAHIGVSLLFLLLVHRVSGRLGGGGPFGCASISAFIFAVHPVHTEAVTCVVGRAELLSALFLMWAMLAYSKGQWLCALILTQVAHGCKESGLLGYALFVWLDIVYSPPRNFPRWRCVAWLSLLGANVLARDYLLAGHTTPSFTRIDNPLWYMESSAEQVLTTLRVHYEYARLLVWPWQLCCDYSPKCLPDCTGPSGMTACLAPALLAYAVALVVFGAALLHSRRRGHCSDSGSTPPPSQQQPQFRQNALPLFAVGLTAITLVPGSHIFLKVGLLVAERILYVPTMGVCMVYGWVVAAALARSKATVRHLLLIVTAMVLGACVLRCISRNAEWKSADSLYASALEVCPHSARINNNVGTRHLRAGRTAQALPYFDAAVAALDDFPLALHNRGLCDYLNGDMSSAVGWYRRSLLYSDPSNKMAYNNMGVALGKVGRQAEAAAAFAAAEQLT